MQRISASVFVTLAVFFAAACAHAPAAPKPAREAGPAPAPLHASRHVIIGRVLSVEPGAGFAFVDLTRGPATSAPAPDTVLLTRRADLTETGRLAATSYARGRTLGTRIVSGQPAPGDEVALEAPR